MLTADHIAAACRDLERRELPDAETLEHLLGAIRRANSGLPWPQAVGTAGSIAISERDAALVRAARWIARADPGSTPWSTAGDIHQWLSRDPPHCCKQLLAHLTDARRRGARSLGRDRVYRIIRPALVSVSDEIPDACL